MTVVMDVCVAICPRANLDASTIEVESRDRICVRNKHTRPRRYRLTPLHGKSPAKKWMECRGREALEWVARGEEVLILSMGQRGLSKRHMMFGELGGVATSVIESLLCEAEGGRERCMSNVSLWEIRNGEMFDLLRPNVGAVESSDLCRRLPVTSVEDVGVLLRGGCVSGPMQETASHVFLRAWLRDGDGRSSGSFCFVDLAGMPHLKGQLPSNSSKSSSPAELCTNEKSGTGYSDVHRLSKWIAAISRPVADGVACVDESNGVLARELRELLLQSACFVICSVSDHPLDYLNTIHTLRLATRISRLHFRPSTCSPQTTLTPIKSTDGSLVTPTRDTALQAKPFSSPSKSTCSPLTSPGQLPVRDGEGAVSQWKRLAEAPEIQNYQSLNATLLNLLDKQKRMHSHTETCLEDVKHEKDEAILQKEVEIDDLKMQLELLRNKHHLLQSSSPYSLQFDAYERETRTQLLQIQHLKEENSALSSQIIEHLQKESGFIASPNKRSPHGRAINRLEAEVASLREENLTIQQKGRCYDFFKKQSALLMKELKRLKETKPRCPVDGERSHNPH